MARRGCRGALDRVRHRAVAGVNVADRAIATASAASCGDGAASSPSSSFTICPTCCFSARPNPTTARLISAGVYSAIGTPRRRGRQQRDAARVPELERAANVLGVEDVLDGDAVRPALFERAPRGRRE